MSGQNFRTIPAPAQGAALYQLSIRAPGDPLDEFMTYTFPVSPASIRYTPSGLSAHADTQGTPAQNGVSRVMDRYGLSPPMILIEGTTGWDYHATDGGGITGLESMQMLQSFLEQYAELNQGQMQAGVSAYYTLEFYDYFLGQFWVIEPEGPQIVRLAADRPILSYYRFYWAAVQAVADPPPPGPPDPVLALFDVPLQVAAVGLSLSIGVTLAAYSPIGPLPVSASLSVGVSL